MVVRMNLDLHDYWTVMKRGGRKKLGGGGGGGNDRGKKPIV